jgi:hypothetical protein
MRRTLRLIYSSILAHKREVTHRRVRVMANSPIRVTMLDENGRAICCMMQSNAEFLSCDGVAGIRSLRIEGPIHCVVTCFDDQQFHSVQITKIAAEPIVVPIARNFIQGRQRNGVYFGGTPTYKWQFNKAIELHWLDGVNRGQDAVRAFFAGKRQYEYLNVGAGVVAYVSTRDRSMSDNNHVSHLSSIKLGD